jgi:hypothetical protein
VDLQNIEENIRQALGFVNREGILRIATGTRYRTRPETGYWRAINHRVDYYLTTDMDGNTLSERIAIEPVGLYSNEDDYVFLRWSRQREAVLEDFELFDRLNVPAGEYEFDRYRAQIRTGVQRPLRVELTVENGGYFDGTRLMKSVELQWRQSEHLFLGLAYMENDVDLSSGRFKSRLASVRTDIAFNSRWSWANLVQFDNTAEVAGINSRLRYLPEAGKEIVLVLNHGATINPDNSFSATDSDLNLRVSYIFRY